MINTFLADPAFLLRMLEIIPKAQRLFLEVDDNKIAFEYIQNEILNLTGSEYGFIAEVIYDSETTLPYLRTHNITNIAWNDSTLNLYNANYAQGIEFRNLDTLFGKVLTEEVVVISNDVATDPRSSGRPEGHPPLNSFLGLPIKHKGKLIAMVGLANRKQGYSNDLVIALDPILQSITSFFNTLQMRKKSEAEKQEKLSLIEKFQKLSDIVPGMFYQYLLTKEGISSFPYASKGIEKIYKIKSEELRKDASILVNIIHPDDVSEVLDSIIQSANDLKPWSKAYRVIDSSNKSGIRWLFGRSNPEVEPNGNILWHGFITDITEQKENEIELIQSKLESEKANQAKSIFLANVSHEIRTPLNGILGFSELLRTTWLTDIQREYLHNIQVSSEALLDIINDLLDLSHIESKNLKLAKDSVDIRKLIQNLIHTLNLSAKEKGIDLKGIIDQETPEFILTDYVRINQIFTNLLNNSIKFTNSGEIVISLMRKNNKLECKVSDTGIGIQSDKIHRVTEPFFQADSSSTKKYKGTGLGLSITKRILEQMHSNLKIKSEIGKGTEISFVLPIEIPITQRLGIEDETSINEIQEDRDTEHKKFLRILVVEDNELNLLFAKRAILKYYPFSEVLEASNGQKAIDIFAQEKIDLILMDIQMPVMDGYTATQKIRAMEVPGTHVPIIALTAGALAGDREKGLSVGMDEYLTKPIHITALQKVIKNFVN